MDWHTLRTRTPAYVVAFTVAGLVALACDSWYPTTTYRCQPAGAEPRCPGPDAVGGSSYQCCSDDPAALDLFDLDGPSLPAYEGQGGLATPLFSGARNNSSDWGMCVKVGSVPPPSALADVGAQGCPIPCNPTWDVEAIEVVCGEDTICCQTAELDPADCVFDPQLGEVGCWRPVRGDDIIGLGGLELTNWSPDAHEGHQDPGGLGCEAFVAGLSADELDLADVTRTDALLACYRRLGVADQRGFCLGGAGVNICPLAQPSYRDPCEQSNDAEGLVGCG